jgi:hypothetical protein
MTYIYTLELVIYCPQINKDQDICITGKGNWIGDIHPIDNSSSKENARLMDWNSAMEISPKIVNSLFIVCFCYR